MKKFKLKKIFTNICLATSFSVLLSSCSSGSDGDNSNSVKKINGPVSHSKLKAAFKLHPNKIDPVLKSSSGGCGSVMGDVGAGMNMAVGFLNMIPVVGGVLSSLGGAVGAGLTLYADMEGSNCTQLEFAAMQNQLNYQAQQISNIQGEITSVDTTMWGGFASDSLTNYHNEANTLQSSINLISGSSGLMNISLNELGIWDSNSGGLGPNGNLSAESAMNNILTNPTAYNSFMGTLLSQEFGNIVQNISGSSINSDGITGSNANSQYMIMLSSLNQSFVENVGYQANIDNNLNIVPLVANYNNLINKYYQQSVFSLQQIYYLAYLINYINYANYQSSLANGTPLQASYLPDTNLIIKGTYFSPPNQIDSACTATTPSGVLDCYNNAQYNLSEAYANIFNQLYINSASYTIGDPPYVNGEQSWANSTYNVYDTATGTAIATTESLNFQEFAFSKGGSVWGLMSGIYAQNNRPNLGQYTQSLGSTYQQRMMGDLVDGNVLLALMQSNLTNPVECGNNLESYNLTATANSSLLGFWKSQAQNGACNSAYSTTGIQPASGESAIASLNTLNPYIIAPEGMSIGGVDLSSGAYLSGNVSNNVYACSDTSQANLSPYNFYIWSPPVNVGPNMPSLGQSGTLYFLCGNWNSESFPIAPTNTSGSSSLNGQLYYQSFLNPGQYVNNNWDSPVSFNYTSNSTNPNYYTTTILAGQRFSGSGTQTIVANALSSNYPENYNTDGSGFANIAHVQFMLPSGMIIPMVYGVVNLYKTPGSYAYLGVNPYSLAVEIDGTPLVGDVPANGIFSTQFTPPAQLNGNYNYTTIYNSPDESIYPSNNWSSLIANYVNNSTVKSTYTSSITGGFTINNAQVWLQTFYPGNSTVDVVFGRNINKGEVGENGYVAVSVNTPLVWDIYQ